jgi:hypothetical protein
MTRIKYIVIDSQIFQDARVSREIFDRIFENAAVDLSIMKVLILKFNKYGVLYNFDSYFQSNNIATIELKDKSEGIDLKAIFNFFSKLDPNSVNNSTTESEPEPEPEPEPPFIDISKQILYISKRTNSYIKQINPSVDCPGFIAGRFCAYCSNICAYCYLNLAAFSRRPVMMFVDFDKIQKELFQLQKQNNRSVINTSVGTDISSITEIFPEYWNILCEYAEKSKQALLFITKGDAIYKIPPATAQTMNNVYAWSMNTRDGIQELEPGTASFDSRVAALKHMKDLGYRVAIWFDPIYIKEMFDSFFTFETRCNFSDLNISPCLEVIDVAQKLECEAIQFGLLRLYERWRLTGPIKYPKNYKNIFTLSKTGRKLSLIKFPDQLREKLYLTMLKYAQKIKNKRICHEPEIHINEQRGTCICQLDSCGPGPRVARVWPECSPSVARKKNS